MREVQVSDDVAAVWLSPERCRAARSLLNWSPSHLSGQVAELAGLSVSAASISAFEDFGEMLGTVQRSAVLAVLLRKVEFTTAEGEPGVVRKRAVGEAQGEGYLQFGGPRRRRAPL